MPNANQCQTCQHFLELPLGSDAKLYFCDNPRTKEGPCPIGFIVRDAPACALYASFEHAYSATRPTVIVVTPSPETSSEGTALIESKAVRVAILISTLVGLASWLLSHIPPSMMASIEAKLGF